MFILTKATSQVFSKITNTNNLSRNLFQILFSPRQSLIIIFGTIIDIERESRGEKILFLLTRSRAATTLRWYTVENIDHIV